MGIYTSSEFNVALTTSADQTKEGYVFTDWSSLLTIIPVNDVDVTTTW
ncbi:MAG TPA: hypothetical protein VJX93_02310 [Candidatus Methanomethylophilaceae archaeon]|nr:hypothetical protein [Candidatus Methanomethylophilaceae archaeon]